MDLAKALRKGVRETIWPFLHAQGFTEFSELAAWRRGERWIDCVEIQPLGATTFGFRKRIGWEGSHEIDANAATFSLQLGSYYTDVHLLPWTGPIPERPRCPKGEAPRYPTCHRLRSLARSYEYGNAQGTLFPSADDGSDLPRAIGDALEALRSRGMSWLESTHDIGAYLARADGDPEEYAESTDEELQITEEERGEIQAWAERNGIEAGEPFAAYGIGDMPRLFLRLQQVANLRDHTAAEPKAPYGDLLYGLLVGEGRPEEAIAIMLAEDDEGWYEKRYAEMLAQGWPKRTVNATRKREEARRQKTRDHLAMLQAHLAAKRATQ